VEHRGNYYDQAGALRDMVQNHLLQILCLVAMEPPISFDADEIRNKKVDVLQTIRPIPQERVHEFAVGGQYDVGWIGRQRVPAYRAESGVVPTSSTETFAAIKLFVDNWRWQDVPFSLRTGKRLPAVDMRFSSSETFGAACFETYETLLVDVMRGDPTLFMRADQVEAAWSVITPILEAWQALPTAEFPNYPAGTWGPEAAETLIARDGRCWALSMALEPQAKGVL
jgi:glucose-6-phosphate 1-dehydrogenase